MAIYHLEAKVITRGVGRSVVSATAYASCSEIYNDYDGILHNYTKKGGLVHSEVLLPPNAPKAWTDRAELWNAVEAAKKSKNSQLARELIVDLPVELKSDEWITMLQDFISENCVNKGMCADSSIHDTDGHNPHAHILLTMRPLDERGKWQAKTQKEYICKRGDKERGFTADEFKTAQADGWEKQYQCKVGKKKIYMTPSEVEVQNLERVSKNPKSTRYGRQNPICTEWNSDEQILQWRKAWEDVTNLALEQKNIAERVDCRSFKERCIDEQPTIHEGVSARIIEQRGGVSERCETNRQIRKDNILLREIKEEIKKLIETVKGSVKFIASELEGLRNKVIFRAYELRYNNNLSDKIQQSNMTIDCLLWNYTDTNKELDNKTEELKILKSEQKNLSSLHIFKRKNLSERIEKLQSDIKKLKSQKSSLLDRMNCKTEADIEYLRKDRKKDDTVLENIFARNAALIGQKKENISEFKEIRSGIASEDMEAVQNERYNLHDEYARELSQELRDKYGSDYDYAVLRDVEGDVNRELGEKPLSMKRKLQRNRQRSAGRDRNPKHKKREQEL